MADDASVFDADAVVPVAGHPLFRLVPLIRDLLRTRYCAPRSVFLVEGVEAIPVSASGRWQALRLLLGDGDLCIQAMLDGPMHRFIENGEVSVGTYIRVDSFSLAWERVDTGQARARDLVFLILEDMTTIGWNESYRDQWRLREAEAVEELAVEGDIDLDEASREYATMDIDMAQLGNIDQPSSPIKSEDPEDSDDDAEEAFDAFESTSLLPPKPASKVSDVPKTTSAKPKQQFPVALPRDWHDPQTPLKLTALRSLPYLPYKQNWSCNILCIIVSLSPVEPSHLPPYEQRIVRIADPSTAKRVLLTVFLDPHEFTPKVGSAVLLVGVKNHHFDGGSLKKYASDKKYGRWWFEDPFDMPWCDVQTIKDWWAEAGSNNA